MVKLSALAQCNAGYHNKLEKTAEVMVKEVLINNQKVQDFISAEITNQLKGAYGGYEIPKKFLFIAEEFTLENGMLTQTMKLKRRNVIGKFGEQLESLYKS